MPVRARLVVPGGGAAVTRSPRSARPDRDVAASTRIGPGRCHSVLVRAWRLRDHGGRWGWRGAAGRLRTGTQLHPDARHRRRTLLWSVYLENFIHPHDGDRVCFHLVQHPVIGYAKPAVTATDK